jgi:hypothetical protein
MAREDRWRENRNWDFDREAREMQSRPDYGQTDGSRGYAYSDYRDDRDSRDYREGRGYREEHDERDYRDFRRNPTAERYRAELHGRDRDERAYRPFGTTGPTAYYPDNGWSSPGAFAPYGMGLAPNPGAGYAPRREAERERRYTPNPREGRGEESRSWIDKATDTVASWFGDENAQRRHGWDETRAGHRGRGPKGYRRSDERIRDDVNDRLTEDPYLDATEIEVAVSEADVTLTGYVRYREDKRRAERLAEDVAGVRDVQNNIRLRRDEAGDRAPERAGGNF